MEPNASTTPTTVNKIVISDIPVFGSSLFSSGCLGLLSEEPGVSPTISIYDGWIITCNSCYKLTMTIVLQHFTVTV